MVALLGLGFVPLWLQSHRNEDLEGNFVKIVRVVNPLA